MTWGSRRQRSDRQLTEKGVKGTRSQRDCDVQGKRAAGFPILIPPRQGLPSFSASEARWLARAVMRVKISFRPGFRHPQSFAPLTHLSVVCFYRESHVFLFEFFPEFFSHVRCLVSVHT